ncbi:hypothetical protein F3I27_23700 [Pantoea sp. Bo_2]|uniref:helix-turn-helix domain-containing protein n=1 Tax=unclassified Pantoea TaxID=2630326 RepID=UPI0012320430|nr:MULTISPECIES: helix-turn-helix domain-containing protein [unclassified Pantoea]KAA5949420.1 hypothetical protein F3I55_22835 [Pantoea sp. VH_24]KAA5955293.1 hypothetical protein F3I53_20195 [Pantoea sp. VH_16]KAA5961354.1 hypothetical protein F3I54_19770 [Pantoea sp. VH_18]KAA5991501.1 hypothetical protein F3I46_22765 [Pantoea sp. M_1]KAA5997550.1 hypothetical protein F3I45_20780 [Pantoea sp. F_7]
MNISASKASRFAISASSSLIDPAAKLITMLQAIEGFSCRILNESDRSECKAEKIALYAGNILDLVELCIYVSNIATSPSAQESSNFNEKNTPAASSSSTPLGPLYYPTAETIGTRIKSMRMLREFGWSDLAGSVDVTRSCIEAWEENTTIPASDKIIPLANALNCDPMWLLTGDKADAQRTPE